MIYKKCPKCELNYISENETLCSSCKKKNTTVATKIVKKKTDDFSCIVRGRVYGTNSNKIYKDFCDSLGWDISKAGKFGRQKPLYAENCDTNRENDVWFIFYPSYDKDRLDCIVDDVHVVNLIQNNGDNIIEIVDDKIGKSNDAKRITFVRTDSGYEFFGVYKLVKNGTTRIYERISDNYSIK